MKLHKILIIEYAIVICLSVFVTYLYKDQIYSKLRDYKLVYIPESFTELFFTDHLNLPTTISANVDQTFAFTIHNLENKDMSYSWEVFVVPDFQLTLKESSASAETSMAKGVTEASESTSTQNVAVVKNQNIMAMPNVESPSEASSSRHTNASESAPVNITRDEYANLSETQKDEIIMKFEKENRVLVKSGVELIKDQESRDVTVTFKLPKVGSRQKVVVRLVDLDQTVHFWVVGLGV